MLDACYDTSVVQSAVDLANTLKPVRGEDFLESVGQLHDFLDDHPALGPVKPSEPAEQHAAGARWSLTEEDLAEVRSVRETVRAVLERASTDAAGAVALVNDGLRRSRATPVLRVGDGGWRTEVVSGTDRCSAHLAAAMFGALASVIATLGPNRLGACAGPNCRGTFVDLSRNGSKQYCTRACAHRVSVAAYRSRNNPG
ncbi:CGNR zinc finger domain-containing protein [Lentzea sp. NPDC060358]|uniref:CGNR zinc finger domain-containing protein n=1 Tax=Lentzea sp. NPDC060358 TaxID=3347103 RepID=UPI003662089E